jgi:predicted RNase H-like HicB family nuclease
LRPTDGGRFVVEETAVVFSAFPPDLPGCVATASTHQEVEREMASAVSFHIDGMREEGLDLPVPHTSSTYVDVPA